jgi:hypothetical protein
MERLQKTIFGGSPMSESVNPGRFTSVGSLTKKCVRSPVVRSAVRAGKKSQESGKSHKPTGESMEKNLSIDPSSYLAYFTLQSANIQSAGKGRGDLKTALLRKIHGSVDIALFTSQLHTLNTLDQQAIFQAFVFREILFLTVFTWRRNHGGSFPCF